MSRWITVANRLPFSINKETGLPTTASGGLVSALNGVRTAGERLWVGCAPDGLNRANWREDWPVLEKKMSENSNADQQRAGSWSYHPVFPEKSLYDAYYNRCCNDVLWPLLHYQPELVTFESESWEAYRQVNQKFADELIAIAKPDDLIWIQDFHLFLLPKMLKAARPELRVGFFLHVPFPSSEVFRQLPVREEILKSLLEADLVGFHDYSYLRHFSSSVLRLLGLGSNLLSIRRGAKTTRLGVFPVSIDTELFRTKAKSADVQALAKKMEKSLFYFLGVDRLDYMKGLDLKLKSFRLLLKMFPQYREKVCLLQIAVPTRTGVPVYMKLASEVARLVGEINGEFSTPNWTPIHYIHNSVDNNTLIAMYRMADALIVSSKRDGMNLVALEYIASQGLERPGVVLLSEFAGAVSVLSHALPINPWDLKDCARKMQVAMEMPKQEKIWRQQNMQKYLDKYTATTWAEAFIHELEKQAPTERPEGPPLISYREDSVLAIRDKILSKKAKRVVVFVDYDGTLVPIEQSPELAVLRPEIKEELRRFSRFSWLDLVIVSGRDSRFLTQQFEELPLQLAAEHGAKSFDPAIRRWKRHIHRSRASWYPIALKILSDYTDRVPHSQVEKKHFTLAWHYRQSPQDYAEFQARKLAQELELGLANLPVSIIRGKKVIEVRAIEADKGLYAMDFLRSHGGDEAVCLAFGDDRTDEDLFGAVKGHGLSFKVGPGPSTADYALTSQLQLMPFLIALFDSLDSRLKTKAHTRSRERNERTLPLMH